jgi:hypothetical protein
MRIQMPLQDELRVCEDSLAVAHEDLPEDLEDEIAALCAGLPAPIPFVPYRAR